MQHVLSVSWASICRSAVSTWVSGSRQRCERMRRPCRLGQWHVGGSVGSVSEGLRCLSSLWQEQRQQFESLLPDS